MMHGRRIGEYRISQDQSGRYARHFATGQLMRCKTEVRSGSGADIARQLATVRFASKGGHSFKLRCRRSDRLGSEALREMQWHDTPPSAGQPGLS